MFETIVNLETKQKGLERNYLEKANADQTIQRTAFLLIKGMVELASLIQGGAGGLPSFLVQIFQCFGCTPNKCSKFLK